MEKQCTLTFYLLQKMKKAEARIPRICTVNSPNGALELVHNVKKHIA